MSRPARLLADLIIGGYFAGAAELADLHRELEWRCENHPHGMTPEEHLSKATTRQGKPDPQPGWWKLSPELWSQFAELRRKRSYNQATDVEIQEHEGLWKQNQQGTI